MAESSINYSPVTVAESSINYSPVTVAESSINYSPVTVAERSRAEEKMRLFGKIYFHTIFGIHLFLFICLVNSAFLVGRMPYVLLN